ncbi:hypothetical protein A10D4_03945 [Idiomarina xiamenensis 10-D-4]|uniref:Sulfate exporter family transporter n=1 Tax=Idiomarina xiamenensis 10-D-4 TaxID=740709 RepID=K2KAB1_9GAMM|nr:hypothetical protein A10D4_03945 [Idiomarina xiamenensis 10-D-4]
MAAVEPVIKAAPYKVAVAVATVVIFGTASMFIYPLLYPLTGFNESQYGLWVGAAVHEVAQVVVAGAAVSADAAHIAVTEKMIRVMMLVPLLLVISIQQTGIHSVADIKRIKVPWFAVAFLLVIMANSWVDFLAPWRDYFTTVAGLLLALAMAALGVLTHLSVLKKAGVRALLLAALLFSILIAVSWLLVALF